MQINGFGNLCAFSVAQEDYAVIYWRVTQSFNLSLLRSAQRRRGAQGDERKAALCLHNGERFFFPLRQFHFLHVKVNGEGWRWWSTDYCKYIRTIKGIWMVSWFAQSQKLPDEVSMRNSCSKVEGTARASTVASKGNISRHRASFSKVERMRTPFEIEFPPRRDARPNSGDGPSSNILCNTFFIIKMIVFGKRSKINITTIWMNCWAFNVYFISKKCSACDSEFIRMMNIAASESL